MKISEYYIEKCNDENWYNSFFQCGDKDYGSIFKCFGTNYRDLSKFEYYFKMFKKYINIPRNEWDKKETTGQEIAKQYVVNMVDSFLYLSERNDENELIYKLSSRGQDFEKMTTQAFNEKEKNEKRLLLIIYLMNSSFKKTPRYLLKQSWKVWNYWKKANLNEEKLFNEIKIFLKTVSKSRKVDAIFNYDIIWDLSFYTDIEFLKLYNISSNLEKDELKRRTKNDYKNLNHQNVLSWKYKSTNFQRPTLFDTLIIIYLAKVIKDCQNNNSSFDEFYLSLINSYSNIYHINKEKVKSYIFSNENIFKVIFKNAISIEDDFTERYVPEYKPLNKNEIKTLLSEKIDPTSEEGVIKLEVVRNVLKKLAKEKSQYKCALHEINDCKYFTSKDEHKNYLEIHHLIPREFSYNFENTIECVENYIPLCPRCHRMIHKAEDRERIGMINYLFSKRHEELAKHNINVTLKELYDFYKIDNESKNTKWKKE